MVATPGAWYPQILARWEHLCALPRCSEPEWLLQDLLLSPVVSFPSALKGRADQEEGVLAGRDSRTAVGPEGCAGDRLLQGQGREVKQGILYGRG